LDQSVIAADRGAHEIGGLPPARGGRDHLERMLAMLLRLKDLRQGAIPA